MRLWIVFYIVVPYTNGQLREAEYECGSHGRFEYCIDGVPGCVVGCHCHPGYYFDTDTKICEPNIRLTQNFRRNNYEVAEPTRVYLSRTPPTIEEPATSPKTAVDEKIDIITQDADDLGDWLYNQFFKTIENQVINETKDESILTRRSDNAPTFVNKPTRRSHKYWRAKRKKKKKRKNGLRSKLLRITEDDSLFDSSSNSNSASDDSSDSSSSSASDNRENTKEYKIRGKKSDHGHKKIVVFNKRPKPPLPSFIFLPNMETPFFPPIGLPPPPMPMYPMVPVPPMVGPFPFPVPTPPCNTAPAATEGTTASTANIENKPSTDAATVTEPSATEAEDEGVNENPSENNTEANEIEAADENQDNTEAGPNQLRNRVKKRRGPRNKLVQKLRDKLKRKSKLQNYFAQTYQDPEMQMMSPPDMEMTPANFMPGRLPGRHKTLPEINVEEELAAMQDVDFKYLSQLIHRADLNRTSQSSPPPLILLPTASVKDTLTVPPPGRRNYNDGYPDQITRVLSNLANHPSNLNPDNQASYHSLNQASYNLRTNYDSLNQAGNNILNQPAYKTPNQHSMDALSQQTYNMHNQKPYNAHSQQLYNESTNNVPNQPNFNLPNKSNYNFPNKPSYNTLNQPTYIAPNNPSYSGDNQHSYNSPNPGQTQLSYKRHNSPIYNIPNNKPPNQFSYDVPNRQSYNTPHQQAYNPLSHSTYNPNQPTHVSLNKPLHTVPYRKKIEDTNDSYYSNLGRQIASMIRNIDGDKEVDIEIKASSNDPNNPILIENDGSRSYWERFVRSPYNNMINSFKKEINNLKGSNENLFSIENKVSMAILRKPTMSLHELENIISKMHQAKFKFTEIESRRPNRITESSKTSYNVNLLPGHVNNLHFLTKYYDASKDRERFENISPKQLEPEIHYLRSNNSINTHSLSLKTKRHNTQSSSPLQNQKVSGSLLTNFMFTLQASNEVVNETVPKLVPTRKSFTMPPPPIVYKMPPHFKSYSYTVLPLPLKPALLGNIRRAAAPYIPMTTKRTLYQQLNPMIHNQKKLHIYDRGNNNQYLVEKPPVPMNPRSFARAGPVDPYETYGTRVEPSYFHHEVHHFDYFDDLS